MTAAPTIAHHHTRTMSDAPDDLLMSDNNGDSRDLVASISAAFHHVAAKTPSVTLQQPPNDDDDTKSSTIAVQQQQQPVVSSRMVVAPAGMITQRAHEAEMKQRAYTMESEHRNAAEVLERLYERRLALEARRYEQLLKDKQDNGDMHYYHDPNNVVLDIDMMDNNDE